MKLTETPSTSIVKPKKEFLFTRTTKCADTCKIRRCRQTSSKFSTAPKKTKSSETRKPRRQRGTARKIERREFNGASNAFQQNTRGLGYGFPMRMF
ncbi:MAG: hypothetical protein L0Y55_08895, partial [Anaerolineales bacterium]|nr:hypothetical protein [Anaerolineales bacterium]